MTVQEVRPLVLETMGEVFAVAPAGLTDARRFAEDLGADSLDQIDMISRLEGKLQIDIPDADIDGLKTVGDTIAYCERRVADLAA